MMNLILQSSARLLMSCSMAPASVGQPGYRPPDWSFRNAPASVSKVPMSAGRELGRAGLATDASGVKPLMADCKSWPWLVGAPLSTPTQFSSRFLFCEFWSATSVDIVCMTVSPLLSTVLHFSATGDAVVV